jgi:putative transposase
MANRKGSGFFTRKNSGSVTTFATIRLRHRKTKGSGNRKASLVMMFKLAEAAAKRWRRLDGHQHIISLLQGKKFVNGIQQAAA